MTANLPAIPWGKVGCVVTKEGGRAVVAKSMDEVAFFPGNVPEGATLYLSDVSVPVPAPWDWNAWVIWQGEKAMLDATRPGCGACRACCITLYIADVGDGFTKPSHRACGHLCNAGCGIYENRPRTCSAFECVWLKSQRGNRAMPPELRPDRCGAILTDHDEGATRVHVDPSYPKSAALQAFITAREAEGEAFAPVTHYYGEG